MKVGFLITARLKSTRLPKKLLKDLNGYMVIERVIQRAKQVMHCDGVVLCTSEDAQDDPLVDIAESHDISVHRGQPVNVLERLKCAAENYGFDFIVGITADNPLFSIEHASRLAQLFRMSPEIDYAYTAGLPLGVNVYGMRRCALVTVCRLSIVEDTEIWGRLLNQPAVFNVHKEEVELKYKKDYRMTLDEPSDYEVFKNIYAVFDKDTVIPIDDAIDHLNSNQDITALNKDVLQKDIKQEVANKINTFYVDNHESTLEMKFRLCGSR